MFRLGMPEVVLILTIGLLLFGKRLPDMARSLGKSLMEFKRSIQGVHEEIDSSLR